jgi:hypothetical protein
MTDVHERPTFQTVLTDSLYYSLQILAADVQ